VIAYNYCCAQVEDAASQLSMHITNFQILYQKGKAAFNQQVQHPRT